MIHDFGNPQIMDFYWSSQLFWPTNHGWENDDSQWPYMLYMFRLPATPPQGIVVGPWHQGQRGMVYVFKYVEVYSWGKSGIMGESIGNNVSGYFTGCYGKYWKMAQL